MRLTKEMADALKVRICGMAWAYDLAQVEAGTRESLISIRHIVTTLDSLVETEQLLTREDGDLLIMELDQHAVTDDGKYIREVAVDIIEHFIEQEPPDLFPDSRCEEDMSAEPSASKPAQSERFEVAGYFANDFPVPKAFHFKDAKQYRIPKYKEWYLSDNNCAIKSNSDRIDGPAQILMLVPDAEPVKPSFNRIPRDGKERHNVLHDCDTCGYGFGNGICGAPEELGNCRDHSLWIPIVKRSAPKPIDWQPGKDEI